jgi:hypothetical protein
VKRRPDSISAALSDAATWYDVVALLTVPVALVAVFALPFDSRIRLALVYADPSALSLYAANFTHFSFDHLLSNLVGYLLVAPTAYALCVLADYRRTFWGVFAIFVFAFPVVLSVLNVEVFKRTPYVALGFSGVLAAFFGFLPVALLWYLRRRFTGDLVLHHAPLLYFTGIATIATIAVPLGRASYLVLAGAPVRPAFVAWRLLADPSLLSVAGFRRALTPPGYVELAVLGLVLFLGFPFAAFPSISMSSGTFTNLYLHLVGYSMGYLVPYLTFTIVSPDATPYPMRAA